jgi:pseudouridine synthase
MQQSSIRLQKILSAAGVASRRVGETLIAQGRVSVNGRTVTELGTTADPERDEIRVDGRRLRIAAARQYYLLYKPRGYVCTRSDPQKRPTIIDLLAERGIHGYLYPVGRLDFDSEGLILVTNDGDLAARLTHPRHGVEREYEVRVRGVPDERTLDRLRRGVLLEGRRTAPAGARLVAPLGGGAEAVLAITLREGRNRQVRNMCDLVGHPVVRLRRVRIGPIADRGLRSGQVRTLTAREVHALKLAGEGRALR